MSDIDQSRHTEIMETLSRIEIGLYGRSGVRKQSPKAEGSPWNEFPKSIPEKPGLSNYEHVPCIVYLTTYKEVKMLMWNCEHLCWDDADGDDISHYAKDVTHWMIIPPPPIIR